MDTSIRKLRRGTFPLVILVALYPSLWAVDCNRNDVEDLDDIAAGTSQDCNANEIPDECDVMALRIDFSEPREFPTRIEASEFAKITARGDFDGDDDIDLVVLHAGSSGAQTTGVTLLRNVGDGTFEPPEFVTSGRGLTAMVSADLEQDGDLDLVIARQLVVHAFMNQADGTFERGSSFLQGRQVSQLAAADFDGDGDVDIATTGAVSLVVLDNQDGVDFSVVVHEHEFGAETLPFLDPTLATDIDNDGFADLLVPNLFTKSYWLFRNDRGVFQHPEVLSLPRGLISGDLDGDGDIDFVAGRSLFFNDGRAVFKPAVELDLDRGGVRAVEDVDLDGDLDLLASTGQTVLILGNDGSGSFSLLAELQLRDSPDWLSAADLDGDGDGDLLAVFGARNKVSVRLRLDEDTPEHPDVNQNGIPDACESDCNRNGVRDKCAPVAFRFVRGDCNRDGTINLTDAICVLDRLFAGEEAGCMTSLDTNADTDVNLTDPVFLLGFLFGGGPAPPEPFPDCGPRNEADQQLGCDSPPDCQ